MFGKAISISGNIFVYGLVPVSLLFVPNIHLHEKNYFFSSLTYVSVYLVVVSGYQFVTRFRKRDRYRSASYFMMLFVLCLGLSLVEATFSGLDYRGLFGYKKNYEYIKNNVGTLVKQGRHTGYRICRSGADITKIVVTGDRHNVRVVPRTTPLNTNRKTVAWFGDSLIFGEWLQDDQTAPFYLQAAAGGRYLVKNFGISGASIQTLLGGMQEGVWSRALAGQAIDLAILQYGVYDMSRPLGVTAYKQQSAYWPTSYFGPYYRPSAETGGLVNIGMLGRVNNGFVNDKVYFAHAWLMRRENIFSSGLLRVTDLLFKKTKPDNSYPLAVPEDEYMRYYFSLVRLAYQKLKQVYPSVKIVYIDQSDVLDQAKQIYSSHGFKPELYVQELVPFTKSDQVLPCDGHPNMEYNKRYAEKLLPFVDAWLSE